MSDKIELLPCPFCGQQDAFVEQLDADASVVICQGRIDEYSACLARGPVGVQESDEEDQPGRGAAIRDWNRRAAVAQQPAPTAVPEGFLLVTPEQLERHATTAWECPPQSRVVLVSSIKRLHGKNAAAPAAPATAAAAAAQHSDDLAVDRFAAAMKVKLAAARAKGRRGWEDPDVCSDVLLAKLLVGHLKKGNPGTFEDVANFAMMLHQRGADPMVLAGVAAPPAAEQPANPKWARMDPTFVVDFLRHSSEFDADLVGEMLEFARVAAEQPDTVKVERELLENIDQHYQDGLSINPELEQLRALLGKDGEV